MQHTFRMTEYNNLNIPQIINDDILYMYYDLIKVGDIFRIRIFRDKNENLAKKITMTMMTVSVISWDVNGGAECGKIE